MIGDSCVIGAMVDGNVCVVSAVNDGSCSPWVMCSCSVVSGNQIRDRYVPKTFKLSVIKPLIKKTQLDRK